MKMITECEIEYLKCFCEAYEQHDFIRFYDALMPDQWCLNYTWVKSIKNEAAFIQLIESEVAYSKSMEKDFCVIKCQLPINHSILKQLSHTPEISTAGYYVFDDFSNLSKLSKINDSHVAKVDKTEMLEDVLVLDLEHDGDSDFCARRINRCKDIYLSDGSVDSYICYHNNKAVGNCNLFIHNGIAKIEDFAVSPSHQRKGFGITMMKTLIEIAMGKNVTAIYLETDEGDPAKDMFQKCGFYKVAEFTDLMFKF